MNISLVPVFGRTIQMEVKLTGIIGVSAETGDERPDIAPLVAPNVTCRFISICFVSVWILISTVPTTVFMGGRASAYR